MKISAHYIVPETDKMICFPGNCRKSFISFLFFNENWETRLFFSGNRKFFHFFWPFSFTGNLGLGPSCLLFQNNIYHCTVRDLSFCKQRLIYFRWETSTSAGSTCMGGQWGRQHWANQRLRITYGQAPYLQSQLHQKLHPLRYCSLA